MIKTLFWALFSLWAFPARALDSRIIDFESLPDGSQPVEGLSISNQFMASHGVNFIFENGAYPQIAEIGWPTNKTGQSRPFAFWGPPDSSNPDVPALGQNVGRFFLTDGRAPNGLGVSGIPPPLLIFLAHSSSNVSGEILDIQNEGFLIQARGQQTQLLASVLLEGTNCPNCGDGKAAPFFISTNGIWSLRIASTQTNGSVGWGFDNFCPNLAFAPANLTITNSQRNLQLGIGGAFGKSYLVEYRTNLLSEVWRPFGAVSLTNSPTQILQDSGWTNDAARFYRAVAVP